MKTIKLLALIIMVLFASACKNQQSKKVEKEIVTDNTQVNEKLFVENIEKTENPEQIYNTGKTNKSSFKTSEQLVHEILTTSPRYKQLTKGLLEAIKKNGGQSFGIRLEGSPNPKQDNSLSYSKTYDYTLYETYKERQVNTTRFSFDPNNNQLYEYDEVNEILKQIDFDKDLLNEYILFSNSK